MKIFFDASNRSKKQYSHLYKLIFNTISELGYGLVDDDVVKIKQDEFYNTIKSENKGRYTDLLKKKLRLIQKADICIFETSVPSFGVGYIMYKAIEYGKPTICLSYEGSYSDVLNGIEEDKFILKTYTENNIKEVLDSSLTLAWARRDKRFNFFLNTKLLDYLEEASKRERTTKSKLMRDLIVQHMRQNAEDSFPQP